MQTSASETTGDTNSPNQPGAPPAPGAVVSAQAVPGRLLGTIKAVGNGGAFVLVETYGAESSETLSIGQSLQTEPGEESPRDGSAMLRVAKERRPPFIVADVVSGKPHTGDTVYLAPTTPAQYNPFPRSVVNPSPAPAVPVAIPVPDLRQTP